MRALLALLPILYAAEAIRGPVTVALAVHGPATSGKGLSVRVTATPLIDSSEKSPPLPVSVTAAGVSEQVFNLLPGRAWRLYAEVEGYWCGERTVLVPVEGSKLVLDLWRTGTLRGDLRVPERDVKPASLTIGFLEAPGVRVGVPEGEVACPLADKGWSCAVPAGTLDLRLRAEGFVSHFFWGITLPPGGTLDVGTLALRRGASVVGWVTTSEGPPDTARCQVRLEPQLSAPAPSAADEARLQRSAATTVVNERGFFHAVGVPPGSYTITAEQPGFAHARRPAVTVIENAETELSEPLVLERPASLDVLVRPPADPYGARWRVEIWDIASLVGYFSIVARTVVGEDGTAHVTGLTPGIYRLKLKTENSENWVSQDVDIRQGQPTLELDVPLLRVRGTVRLGKRPLVATLWFGGEHGAVRVRADSDRDGNLQTILPHAGAWRVDVVADRPRVRRTLKAVEVSSAPGAREARVELNLPDTALLGNVVDEAGAAVPKALVTTQGQGDERLQQTRSEGDGSFRVEGLPAGPLLVQAETGSAASDWVSVLLEEGSKAAPVRLVVRRKTEVSGHVTFGGRPVAGARVRGWSSSDSSPGWGAQALTDVTGAFALKVSGTARDLMLAVEHVAFAYRCLRLAYEPGQALELALEQRGATLVIESKTPLAGDDLLWSGLLVRHAGFVDDYFSFEKWAGALAGGSVSTLRVVIPQLEVGDYTVCRATVAEYAQLVAGVLPRARCATVVLPPGGEVELHLPAPLD